VGELLRGGDGIELKAKAERRAGKLYSEEDDVLFSQKHDRVVSFPEMVRDIYDQAEDLIFSLAGNKGETIGSLKTKTLGEVLSFKQRLNVRH